MDKKIIKKTGYVAAATLLVAGIQSCGKYEDGPGISLRTKKARLVGDWDIVQIGTQVFPNQGYSLGFEFEKNGNVKFTYSYGFYSYSYAGDWEFSTNKEELDLILAGQVQTFQIKRLTNKEVWLEDESNDEWQLDAQ